MAELPVFEVDLHNMGSRVKIDGFELNGVRSVKVDQPMPNDGALTVVIEFVAGQVKGIQE